MISVKEPCPACNSIGLLVFFESGQVPVHQNLLMLTQAEAQNCRRGNIRLGFCECCGFVSNLAFDPSLLSYSRRYDATRICSPCFRTYLENLAADLISRHSLQHKKILEIGCGKGEFLSLLCQLGNNTGIGFDPGYEDQGRGQKGLTFIRDLYSERYADCHGDLICCRHVLEHIEQPATMLATVQRSIGQRAETVVFFEVPNLTWILRNVTFWDIYYEHCSYFTAGSLTRLFLASGFNVTHVSEAFDGQFLWLEATPGLEGIQPSACEVESPVDTLRDIRLFASRYRTKMQMICNQIAGYLNTGERCVVWGAGPKGVTLLNTLHLTIDQIEFVVDINPAKQGRYLPGTGQQIIAPEQLLSLHPDVILVMNPNYMAEIQATVEHLGITARLVSINELLGQIEFHGIR